MAVQKTDIVELDESDLNVGRVMEKTEPVVITSKTVVVVPNHYNAVLYVDGQIEGKLKSGAKKKVKKLLGAEKIGKLFSVLYISKNKLPLLPWGSGNLPIEYPQFKGECIKVGANGTFTAEIKDPIAFYDCIKRKKDGILSIDEVKSRVISEFRTCISGILSEIFIEAIEPIFDTDFMIDELTRRINRRVCGAYAPNLAGVYFKKASVTGICVCEEDKIAFLEKYNNSFGRNVERKYKNE